MFTKGEWKVQGDIICVDCPTEFGYILPVCIMASDTPDNENEANANLISSAPDMYEALELLLKYAMIHTVTGVVYPEGTHEEGIQNAIKALKKARGANA